MAEGDRDLVRLLHPVGEAFFGDHEGLRPVQRAAIEPIFAGKNVLVAASTASGKTEAVMAPMVARIRKATSSERRIRVLVITPTRALVNDLHKRLEPLLACVGWDCGRQTSDHRDREREPHVLVTTPESFDSALVGGFICDERKVLTDHLLAGVEGVFLDEGHCFAATLRGDQVRFLIQRLGRIREWGKKKGIASSDNVQTCTASATVPNADAVARLLLGEDAIAICVSEARRIEFLDRTDVWCDVAGLRDGPALFGRLPVFRGPAALAKLILEQRSKSDVRKVLTFARSRAEADKLAAGLKAPLNAEADFWVGAHHSSLHRDHREDAEQRFSKEGDAVLVSTSTMEVGVDIGDVDAVCLIGPPPTVASLLQRIGRGNRRTRGLTRLIALPEDPLEARVFASQLEIAQRGSLPRVRFRRHWSVYVQQSLGFIMQSHGEGRGRKGIVDLATRAWPSADTASIADEVVSGLLREGTLQEKRTKLHPSNELGGRMTDHKAHFFANFDAASAGMAVYDRKSGDLLGQIAGIDLDVEVINIGGKTYQVEDAVNGRIEVSPTKEKTGASVRYAARRMPRLEEFCGHARRGCGFADIAAPIVVHGQSRIWFHFGGEVWERLISHLYPAGYFRSPVLGGIAVACTCTAAELARARPGRAEIERAIGTSWESLTQLIECGRFFPYLPRLSRQRAAEELLDPEFWAEWISTRKIEMLALDSDPKALPLTSLLGYKGPGSVE